MRIWLKNLVKNILLLKRKNHPLITINLSKERILNNLDEIKKINPKNKIVPVLKSNAYGHGIYEISKILEGRSEFFVIDSYFEARNLRNKGIKTPLLIIGYVTPEEINNSSLKNIYYTISSLQALRSLEVPRKIHLKIDTGMNRQGILLSEISEAFLYLKQKRKIVLEGICSHLADADGEDNSFTQKQINSWNEMVEKTKKEFPNIKYFHLSNTYGNKYTEKIDANVTRLGIGLYGLAKIPGLDLKPVLEMKTIITGIKKINKGERVGYGGTFEAKEEMTIATIPLGYFEGLDRKLSNKGFVKIGQTFCHIIGNISMNISTIDVSNIKNIKIADEVIVISREISDLNSILNISKLIDSIEYEVPVHIPSHLKRIVLN